MFSMSEVTLRANTVAQERALEAELARRGVAQPPRRTRARLAMFVRQVRPRRAARPFAPAAPRPALPR